MISDKMYTCRRETISGTKYRVEVLDADGSPRLSTSYESEEEVERWKLALLKVNPSFSFRVTPINWSETVCIECGQEVW